MTYKIRKKICDKREEHLKVRYLVIDMWSDYKSLYVLFPNASVIVDKYHYVRQVFWALDNVRKRIQKAFSKDKRIHFKRSRYLLFKAYNDLKIEDKAALLKMLDCSIDLENAWPLKEQFEDMIKAVNGKPSLTDLMRWVKETEESKRSEFGNCIKALTN